MRQIKSIIHNLTSYKPKVLTIYSSNAYLRMLEDVDVHCLHIQGFSPNINQNNVFPNTTFNFINFPQIHHLIDFDAIICFDGTQHPTGSYYECCKGLNQFLKIPLIVYQMYYPIDIHDDYGFIDKTDENIRLYPTEGFKRTLKGTGDVLQPPIKVDDVFNSILNRPTPAITIGDFLLEEERLSNYSHWHSIINATPSAIFGVNPRLGTYAPLDKELSQIYNSAKCYINTRTGGQFPIEILEAMYYGNIIITYPYPGIEDVLPPNNTLNKVVNSPYEARVALNDALCSPDIENQSLINRNWMIKTKNQYLSTYIRNMVVKNYEGTFSFYK